MKGNFKDIKNHLDSDGQIISEKCEILSSFKAAEELAEALLGCTLVIRNRKFIIRMLEIYYGGAGDDAHDWYRNRFCKKTSKYKEQTEVQTHEGFKVYLSRRDIKYKYNRMDIVVGPDKVPISFLLRSVWNENLDVIGAKKGNPNIILQEMGLLSSDHGAEIELEGNNSEICLLTNSRAELIQKGMSVKRQRRIKVTSEFEEKNELLWNLVLE